MSYRIEQTYEYLDNDYWNWRAWIEADAAALDAVVQVTWYLHQTFAEPVVTTAERGDKFAIERSGWGTFQLRAEVQLKDGAAVKLRHELELYYPESEADAPAKEAMPRAPSPSRAQPKRNRVFLSYGIEDRGLAANVRQTLESGGFQVLDASQVAPGQPWQPSLQKMLRESDLVLGLVTSEFASPNLVTELNEAFRSEKPTVAVSSPGVGKLFGLEGEMRQAQTDFDDPASAGALLDLVGKTLKA